MGRSYDLFNFWEVFLTFQLGKIICNSKTALYLNSLLVWLLIATLPKRPGLTEPPEETRV